MDILIIIIIIIAVVKKSNKNKAKTPPKTVPVTVSEMNQNAGRKQAQLRQQMEQQQRQKELKRRLEQKYGNPNAAARPKTPAAARTTDAYKKGDVNSNDSILERAIGNVKEEEKDELKERDFKQHQAAKPTPSKPKMSEPEDDAFMDRVYDLMITGYSGNLEFDRDFIAEGIEMLNRIQG